MKEKDDDDGEKKNAKKDECEMLDWTDYERVVSLREKRLKLNETNKYKMQTNKIKIIIMK